MNIGPHIWGNPILASTASGGGSDAFSRKADSNVRYVFYTESTFNRLYRISIANGTNATHGTTMGSGLRGVAVDSVNDLVYVCDRDGDKIVRIAVDGSGQTNWVTAGIADPYTAVVDEVTGVIYVGSSAAAGTIYAITLAGATVSTIATISEPCFGIGQMGVNGDLLVLKGTANRLLRMTLAGATTLITTGVDAFGNVYGDAQSGKVYYSTAANGIRKINIDGTSDEVVIADGAGGPFGFIGPYGVALDVDNGLIYFADDNDDEVKVATTAGAVSTLYVAGQAPLREMALCWTPVV